MNDPLATYLHDHLAGSHFAIKLLQSLHEQYKEGELGRFALALSAEIKQDQDILQGIIEYVGETGFDLTEAAGWIAEKASQFKLQRDETEGGLGTFEALETLSLGIRGKWALWQALPRIQEFDARVPPHDFARLATLADEQFAKVQEQRLRLIPATFTPQPKPA